MSLGWKKFSFFERDDRHGVEIPDDSTTCSGSGTYLAIGRSNGQVEIPDSVYNAPISIIYSLRSTGWVRE
jgi:hypothetical protein